MSGSLDPQLDVGQLSLNGLSAFSTVLATLSADNVQPVAMLQLEQLGAAFPVSGPLRAQVPDHLQRCKSTRLDRLGLMVGWRKGDAASLMSHSAGGQAVALLATCLENIYGTDSTANIFYKLSKTLLPNAARLSSPKQLTQAIDTLSRKLGVIGFGTILARQVCRIHETYQHIPRKVPLSLLASLSQEGMSDMLSKLSGALQQDKSLIRIRGCASMGYITALAVALFSDDCIITVENMIIHKGCQSTSICIEVTDSIGDKSLQVQNMGVIESLLDLSAKPAQPSCSLKFSYHGHLAAFMQLYLQEWGLLCSPDALVAVGTCILSLSDLIFILPGEASGTRTHFSTGLFNQILGEFPRATLHQRCETALGVSLPLKWRSFAEELSQLERALARSNQTERLSQVAREMNRYGEPSETLFRIIDEGVASLAVHAHDGAVWKECSDREIWYPSDRIRLRGATKVTITPRELLYKLFSWDDPNLIVKSDGTTTLIPSGILHFGNDLIKSRDLELFDGSICYENRYHNQIFAEIHHSFWNKSTNQHLPRMAPLDNFQNTFMG
ncbi:uncharacterized protein N7459_001471 [Penicillium hispanicum]|uniref:uncharacterized protein n=1 Tax=Penicillium hispanicum TaxID=1080232 RepID=UPI002541EA94|nr:uncharacterized protein N7459_001471 [Penicillium hispanicum]KAJ5595263.1 hypothetical protein N7459_001471 [Penicillium hispanicum]